MSEWLQLVKKVYADGKASGMTYSQAMKKAKTMYKKKDKSKPVKKKPKKRKK